MKEVPVIFTVAEAEIALAILAWALVRLLGEPEDAFPILEAADMDNCRTALNKIAQARGRLIPVGE